MGSVMAAIAQMQASQEANHRAVTATLAGIRTDLDHVSRVAWRTHLANVHSGHEPPFPNHPHYPPSFDPREGSFEEPSFRPYPHYPSYYPDGYSGGYFPPYPPPDGEWQLKPRLWKLQYKTSLVGCLNLKARITVFLRYLNTFAW
ncbi:hypothetical protein BVRB_2g042940 [Beta vulgaris subsp. vulgaris]|nr:hypothetical protein BVRB_2g042940 [Beta vulgaris subsp. vulgaris]